MFYTIDTIITFREKNLSRKQNVLFLDPSCTDEPSSVQFYGVHPARASKSFSRVKLSRNQAREVINFRDLHLICSKVETFNLNDSNTIIFIKNLVKKRHLQCFPQVRIDQHVTSDFEIPLPERGMGSTGLFRSKI